MCVFPGLRAVSENSPASPRKNSSRDTSIPQPRTPLSGRFQPSRSARPGAKRHAVPPCFLVFFGCPTIFSFERPPAEHAFHPCFVVLFDAPSHRALKREAGCEKRPHAGDLQWFTRFRNPAAGVVAKPFYSSILPEEISTLCASGRPGLHKKRTESSAKLVLFATAIHVLAGENRHFRRLRRPAGPRKALHIPGETHASRAAPRAGTWQCESFHIQGKWRMFCTWLRAAPRPRDREAKVAKSTEFLVQNPESRGLRSADAWTRDGKYRKFPG